MVQEEREREETPNRREEGQKRLLKTRLEARIPAGYRAEGLRRTGERQQ